MDPSHTHGLVGRVGVDIEIDRIIGDSLLAILAFLPGVDGNGNVVAVRDHFVPIGFHFLAGPVQLDRDEIGRLAGPINDGLQVVGDHLVLVQLDRKTGPPKVEVGLVID